MSPKQEGKKFNLFDKVELEIYEIATLVGFSTSQAFSMAFKQVKAEPPKVYRARWQNGVEDLDRLDPDLCQKAEKLDSRQAKAFLSFLKTSHPELATEDVPSLRYQSGNNGPPGCRVVSEQELERLLAERLWQRIQSLEFEDQRELIRKEKFNTPALFGLLKEISVAEGRRDRTKGLQLAWLVLEAATVSEYWDQGKGGLKARAWAWIGNAQRLLFSFQEAESSFELAERFIPHDAPLQFKAEILDLKAALRGYQRLYKEGLKLENKAIRLFEKTDDKIGLTKALLVRGNLLLGLKRISEAEDNYSRAALLAGQKSDLNITARYNLALCCWKRQDFDAARHNLEALENDGRLEHFALLRCFVNALFGRIYLDEGQLEQATTYLENSYSGFAIIRSKLASLVGLDLAVVSFARGRIEKTLSLVSETLDTAAAWREDPEFDLFCEKLEKNISHQIITRESLIELQGYCDDLGTDPISRNLIGVKGLA